MTTEIALTRFQLSFQEQLQFEVLYDYGLGLKGEVHHWPNQTVSTGFAARARRRGANSSSRIRIVPFGFLLNSMRSTRVLCSTFSAITGGENGSQLHGDRLPLFLLQLLFVIVLAFANTAFPYRLVPAS